MVLRLILRSHRRPGFLATVACGLFTRKLDASVGASGPHSFAVRISAARLASPTRPSHPAPNVRDDREAPLVSRRDAANVKLIWGIRQYRWLRQINTTGNLRMVAMCKLPVGQKPYLRTLSASRTEAAALGARCTTSLLRKFDFDYRSVRPLKLLAYFHMQYAIICSPESNATDALRPGISEDSSALLLGKASPCSRPPVGARKTDVSSWAINGHRTPRLIAMSD